MKLLIVDDQQLPRKTFVRMLELIILPKPICVQAGNGEEALTELQKSIFDIVFLDVSMPVMDGYDACKIIRSEYPLTRLVMLTQLDTENLFFHFFNLGVHSILTKDVDLDEVLTAVEKVRNDEKYFPPKIEALIQKEIAKQDSDVRNIDLTSQEKRLIQLLKEGLTSKEIAREMNLTVNTINTYRDRILEKTKTSNVAQLIALGFQIGILR
jgi:DNA-binding NarL/FixJ family response regulator